LKKHYYTVSAVAKKKKIVAVKLANGMRLDVFVIQRKRSLGEVKITDKPMKTLLLSKAMFKRFFKTLREHNGKLENFGKFKVIVNTDRIWIKTSRKSYPIMLPFNVVYTLFNTMSKVVL